MTVRPSGERTLAPFRASPWFLLRLFIVILTLIVFGTMSLAPYASVDAGDGVVEPSGSGSTPSIRPPLTPLWAYEPWVWEDEENTAAAILTLVDEYRRRDIPVGAAIIDSPWQTNYNTFEFGSRYADPAGLVRELHARDVRVILWATGFLNISSTDGEGRGKAPSYDEARTAGYLVDSGQTFEWEKGEGSAIDFFHPAAVSWWYRRMDRAWGYGIDGWKVDSPEGNLPEVVQTFGGERTEREYGTQYYRAFYRYVANRSPHAIIMARPFDGGTVYAPVDANPVGWVGDQIPDWGPKGIEEAFDNMLASAELGYAVVGSDIGGYRPGPRFDRLFIRWTQLGALSPLMENGGRGEHRPWMLGDAVTSSYRYYAKLHHQLVPYLYSAGVVAHLTGLPIIREPDRDRRQYLLGDDLLVAPIVTRDDERVVTLPGAGQWFDYWDDDRTWNGPITLEYGAPTERIPLFIRGGAIIPMRVDDAETGHGGPGSAGRLTLLVYPDGESERTLYAGPDRRLDVRSRRDAAGVAIDISRFTESYVLRIKEPDRPDVVSLDQDENARALPPQPSWQSFDVATTGWYYDPERHHLWVRFAADDAETRLSYTLDQGQAARSGLPRSRADDAP